MEYLTYKEIQELIKSIRNNLKYEYDFAFPQWIVDEYPNNFCIKNKQIYLYGDKVFVYPNEFHKEEIKN